MKRIRKSLLMTVAIAFAAQALADATLKLLAVLTALADLISK